jgi:hypothetical protein
LPGEGERIHQPSRQPKLAVGDAGKPEPVDFMGDVAGLKRREEQVRFSKTKKVLKIEALPIGLLDIIKGEGLPLGTPRERIPTEQKL